MDVQRIADAYRPGQIGLSVEIFPPKSAEADTSLRETLNELATFRPEFISCTYGAGGSTSKRTIEWCREIQQTYSVAGTAHFTCVGSTCEALEDWLQEAAQAGIRNIMALRGDPPAGTQDFQPVAGGLRYANELVSFIRERFPDWGIGVAGYPEKHPEAPSAESDLQFLADKVAAGANAVFTQLFYDNSRFFRFRDACTRSGIQVPVIPGIMPVTEFSRIKRITALCGATLPAHFSEQLESTQNDKTAQFEIGVEFAIRQCEELLQNGVPGLHLYALNKSHACREILLALGFKPAGLSAGSTVGQL